MNHYFCLYDEIREVEQCQFVSTFLPLCYPGRRHTRGVRKVVHSALVALLACIIGGFRNRRPSPLTGGVVAAAGAAAGAAVSVLAGVC